jgi:cytochrome c biogenesis protein CcmG/thiol:disulfide interchange protein DsbE
MLLLGACATTSRMPPSAGSPLLDRPAPAFERPALSGIPVRVGGAAAGLTVIEFFAGYCEPCQRRLPSVERLHRAHPEVSFVGISLDEEPGPAREQIRRFGLSFPVVHDAGNVLAGRFRVTELPLVMLVGRAGRVLWVGGPGQPPSSLEQALAAAASMHESAQATPVSR